MIDRSSPDSQRTRSDRHPANVGCSFFRYTNDDLRNHTIQRRKHKTWPWEDNQLAQHCSFRSSSTQRGYRKRMIEIWQECFSFRTSQGRADEVRTIIKKGWFSDLEILEIHLKINNTQDCNQYQTHQVLTNKNSLTEMNRQLRKIEQSRRKRKKINQVITYISTNNITELNEQVYAGAKLVCGKIGVLSKSTKKKIKTRMGNLTGNAVKKIYENRPKERRWDM